MDINRQISAEKYVYVCVESFGLVFWNVHNEGLLYHFYEWAGELSHFYRKILYNG